MASLNVVSLPKNFDEINISMSNKMLDLFAMNETRLDSTFTDGLISISGYDLIRKDRSRTGGGVCIYLRDTINYTIREDIVPPDLEAICIEINKPHNKPELQKVFNLSPCKISSFQTFLKIMRIKNFKMQNI